MSANRRLLLGLGLVFINFSSIANDDVLELQLKSLRELFPHAKIPLVSNLEKKSAKKKLRTIPTHESKLLKKVLQNNYQLIALAFRDSDGDGVFDFRINTAGEGRFYEGDPDIDGDGVRNIHDFNPFDPKVGFEDINGNKVPDHIDFELLEKDGELAKKQKDLLVKFGITAFERSAPMSIEALEAFEDSYTRVFKSRPMKTLKTYASEDFAFLRDDDGSTCAMVFTPSQSMMVYRGSLAYHPLFLFALIVHEMAHSYQYQMDWVKTDREEYGRTYFEMPQFTKFLSPFDWLPQDGDLFSWRELFGFASLDENRRVFHYRGESSEDWQEWLLAYWEEHGELYLDHEDIRALGIVGDYSMTNPLEWFADQVASYVLTTIEDHYIDSFNEPLRSKKRKEIISKIRKVELETWPGFKHRNVLYSDAFSTLKKMFPLSEEEKDHLADRYIKVFDSL